MNKLKTIIDLVNQGDKAKLWKYLNKGIYSKKDKIDVVKSKGWQGGGESGGQKVEYFAYKDIPKGMFLSVLYLVYSSIKFLDEDTSSLFICTSDINDGLGLVIGTPLAFKFLPDEKIYIEGEQMTLLDFVTKQGGKSDYDVIPRITESEFYDINNLHQ